MNDERHFAYHDTIETFTAVHQIAAETAKQIGLAAVRAGALTRKDVAETIGVHPITISRWLAAETPDESR